MGLEIAKTTPSTVFLRSQTNFMRTLATHCGIQAITFLGKWPSFKNFVALPNFHMGVLKCAIHVS